MEGIQQESEIGTSGGVTRYHFRSSNNPDIVTPSAWAIRIRFRRDGLRRATSIPPRYVRCI